MLALLIQTIKKRQLCATLSAMTSVKGSAGYVAIEQVSGVLFGKKGSFVLQNFGTMRQGNDRLVLEVVPNSGSGERSSLTGKMAIRIEGGQHYYEFEYELPKQMRRIGLATSEPRARRWASNSNAQR